MHLVFIWVLWTILCLLHVASNAKLSLIPHSFHALYIHSKQTNSHINSLNALCGKSKGKFTHHFSLHLELAGNSFWLWLFHNPRNFITFLLSPRIRSCWLLLSYCPNIWSFPLYCSLMWIVLGSEVSLWHIVEQSSYIIPRDFLLVWVVPYPGHGTRNERHWTLVFDVFGTYISSPNG